jgi:hypothetical protein
MSTAKELSEPLLGDSSQQQETSERECDEVHEVDEEQGGCIGCTISMTFENGHYEDEQGRKDKDGKKVFSWFDHVVVWIILPALLFLQFGMAFYMSNVEAVTGLRWSVVNYSIVLFVVTAVLYRQAAVDCKWTSSFIILLPEILMDVILGMVLFDKIVMAFLFMLISMLCLAMFVVVCSIRVLVVLSLNKDDDDDFVEEKEEAKGEKELAVNLFKGGRVPDTQTE